MLLKKTKMQTNNIELKSPIFKPRPGWGGKLKEWLLKNFYSVILPTLAIILILEMVHLLWSAYITPSENIILNNAQSQNEDIIEKTAGKGQGITHLAREALTDYLEDNSNSSTPLLPAQKIYIETYLASLNDNREINIGDKISFKKTDIALAIKRAEFLTPEQIEGWSRYILETKKMN